MEKTVVSEGVGLGMGHYVGAQFRGGCVLFGPKPPSHAFKMNKKLKVFAVTCRFYVHISNYFYSFWCFEDLELPTHQTKKIVNYVKQMENTKKVLLVDGGQIRQNLKLATQNLHYVDVLPSIGFHSRFGSVSRSILYEFCVLSRNF
ncbi:hypothetical protein CRG98_022216 [Punica granatum]|uniref:Large ribosomal subunit protein uL4m n=1 Tax=Punica granatum TaxID=22663 RepID=A0A2I0JM73_PUNGR|nr:hypothetical protein CRG98_022216 [Punica granatum]